MLLESRGRQQRALAACDVDVVDVDADARVERDDRVALADAARVEGPLVRDARERGEVRDVDADVLERVDAALLEQLAAEHGRGDRRLLEELGPPPRRDHEALDVAEVVSSSSLSCLLRHLARVVGGLLLGPRDARGRGE